jgi:POT family proton-dependent oligopeptide transporter
VPKGHPIGLYVLFGTEMWERFSYYGMRALLVLYLVNHLAWQPSQASGVYKWYTSLVYLTPLLGGFLADRFLGLRASIIIGGVLMAIGHFLMAFEPLPFLYAALAFLIAGNGFFKPNISTLVGKMYTANDPRRDSAFTIFYMGINAGAFLSPLVCGYLAEKLGYHYGFGAAGVGMCLGLAMFLAMQKRILAAVADAGNELRVGAGTAKQVAEEKPDPAETTPGIGGVGGFIAGILSPLLMLISVVVPAYFLYKVVAQGASITKVIMPIAFGGVALWMGLTLRRIKNAARDKSAVIFVLFTFVVLFWMAFEQAGNALNLWAEFNTRLYVGSFKYPAAWFQSVNPLLIVLIAPVFSMMWVWLERRGNGIPTPIKMLVAMFLMAASFVVMVLGAAAENATVSRIPLAALPETITINAEGVPSYTIVDEKDPKKVTEETIFDGRLRYDAAAKELEVRGVLPPFAVTQALGATVTPSYKKAFADIEGDTKFAKESKPFELKLESLPEGFTFPVIERVDGDKKTLVAKWDAGTSTAMFFTQVDVREKVKLLGAGAPGDWRAALDSLSLKSEAARVGAMWLFLSYLLATLGELCLSPVGLSMVTKLAPARYGSLFMGVWLLSNSVAQYVGGDLGESWGIVTPTNYFMIFVWTSLIGAGLLFVLIRPLRKLMHGVK